MHTKCVHTTQHKRHAGGITLIHTHSTALTAPCPRPLHHAPRPTPHAPRPTTLRTEGAQAREQLSRGELPGLQRKSRRREWRLARAPSEALRGASAQCWPSPGADRPESPSLFSNRVFLAWFRPELGSCGGRREKGEWEPVVSWFSARQRFGTFFSVLEAAVFFSALVSFGA